MENSKTRGLLATFFVLVVMTAIWMLSKLLDLSGFAENALFATVLTFAVCVMLGLDFSRQIGRSDVHKWRMRMPLETMAMLIIMSPLVFVAANFIDPIR